MKVSQLSSREYAPPHAKYIHELPEECTLMEGLETSAQRLITFVHAIPADKHNYRYAEGKWTIKDILQHLIDTERIFAYRALVFARYDKAELHSFDRNLYAGNATANDRTIADLVKEVDIVRQATLSLFKSLNDRQLVSCGIASGSSMSVRGLGFVIIGHQKYHQKVFQERYL